jgi:anaerobic selenocysteine-containing dehydrogenase
MASIIYSGDGTSRQRLAYPKLFTGDDWVETNWDHALKIYAGVTKRASIKIPATWARQVRSQAILA